MILTIIIKQTPKWRNDFWSETQLFVIHISLKLFGVNFEHFTTAGFIQIQIHSYKKIENKISFDFQTMNSCVSNFNQIRDGSFLSVVYV